jgi:hypothetical protein
MDDNYDKWEVIDKAEAIAKRSSIWISRDKTLTFFALSEMGDVLGAVWTAFSRDFEYEDPDDPRDVYVYDFDVVVDERFRNPVDKVGLQLIDAAIGEYKDLASTVERSYIRVYVVNRKLIRFLERKYGFTVESEYGHGPVHMVYYG